MLWSESGIRFSLRTFFCTTMGNFITFRLGVSQKWSPCLLLSTGKSTWCERWSSTDEKKKRKKENEKLVHRTKKKKKKKGRGPLCRLKQFTGSTQFDELQHYLFNVRMSAAQSKQISLLEKISNINKKAWRILHPLGSLHGNDFKEMYIKNTLISTDFYHVVKPLRIEHLFPSL